MITFEQWLRKKRHLDSLLGDLANDYCHDVDSYGMNQPLTIEYLRRRCVNDIVITTFRKATYTYKAWRKRNESRTDGQVSSKPCEVDDSRNQ